MIIIRYREISIKGKNRADFERRLRHNIKHCLKKNSINYEKAQRLRGRIVVHTKEKCPKLKNVFGIVNFSYAEELPLDLDIIKEAALKLYKEGTFRITCQRSEKKLLPSQELAGEVGAYVVEKTGAKVSLKEPDQTIFIELFDGHAYIYSEKEQGPGGLPIDRSERVILLLQNQDSLEAGKRIMKRGCAIDVVKENDIDWSGLKDYEFGFTIRELNEIPEDTTVIVSDTVESIKDYPYFVLRSLI